MSNGLMLTAGHNFLPKPWSEVNEYSLHCGAGMLPAKPARWHVPPVKHPSFELFTGYRSGNSSFGKDLAIVRVCSKPPETPFRLPRPGELPELLSRPVYVAGYPNTDGFNGGTLALGVVRLGQSAACDELNGGQVEGTACYHLEDGTLVDTIGGMSGGPVWSVSGDAFVLVAVHVGESLAVLLTSDKVQWIEAAASALSGGCTDR